MFSKLRFGVLPAKNNRAVANRVHPQKVLATQPHAKDMVEHEHNLREQAHE